MKPTILAAWVGPLLVTILLALTALRWRRALRAAGLLWVLSLGMGAIALSGTTSHFLVYAIVAAGWTPSHVERAALDWLLTPIKGLFMTRPEAWIGCDLSGSDMRRSGGGPLEETAIGAFCLHGKRI